MKNIVVLLIFFGSLSTFGQKKHSYNAGQRFIKKADKCFTENQFKNSLQYLSKAEQSVKGYCGSGSIMTIKKIEQLKIKNYFKLNQYDTLLSLLDKREPIFNEDFQKDDSLKIEILKLKFGKEKFKSSFKTNSIIIKKELGLDYYIYYILIDDLKYRLKIRKILSKENNIQFESSDLGIESLIKNTNLYKQIFD